MVLRLHKVFAGYDGSDVLKGLDLEVEKGSITCIVGPNGAGKSTVLRVISGLLKPRTGTLFFDGHSIGGLSPRQILSLGIVQVPQNHSLFPDISVLKNGDLAANLVTVATLVIRVWAEVEGFSPFVNERTNEKLGN